VIRIRFVIISSLFVAAGATNSERYDSCS